MGTGMGAADQLMDLALVLNPSYDRRRRAHVAMLAARLGYVAVHVPVSASGSPGSSLTGSSFDRSELPGLIEAAQPAIVVLDDGLDRPGLVRRNDPELVRRARAAIDEGGQPLVVAIPISIGRTLNEAVARADREPRFTGANHPAQTGIFGTFEQAQDQVLALARAGAEVLLVDIPDDVDVADVLAQVRALVVGATPVLMGR